MNKLEILNYAQENEVKSTNLKSAMAAKASFRKAVESKGFKKVQNWLQEIELKAAKQAEQEAAKVKAAKFNISVAELERLELKANQMLKSFSTGYSMGEMKRLYVNDQLLYTRDETEEYARSCKYRANHGSLRIDLNKTELRNIQNIEGVWTIVNADGTAKWLQESGSKHRYHIAWVTGYVYGTTHSTDSLEAAKSDQAKKDALQKENQAKKEAYEKAIAKSNIRFVGFEHIRALGACTPGIEAFCKRHNLNIKHGYTLGYLKSLNDSLGQRYFESNHLIKLLS